MNVVDSSGWLEFFADGPNAEHFAKPIEAVRPLIVPTISLYEIFRRVLQQRSEDEALQAIALMEQGTVIDLDRVIAIEGACLAAEHRLRIAESRFASRDDLAAAADADKIAPRGNGLQIFFGTKLDPKSAKGAQEEVKDALTRYLAKSLKDGAR